MKGSKIEIVDRGFDRSAGLFCLEVRWLGAYSPAGTAAVELFRRFVGQLSIRLDEVIVDLRLPELQDAELFGHFEHPPLAPREDDALDALRLLRGKGDRLVFENVPSVEALEEEVLSDTGWFSVGGYGVLINDQILVDAFLDGINMLVYSRENLGT